MSKRGENIYKRKDGRWEARYEKGRDLSGRIRYGSCYGKTCAEARKKAERARAEIICSEATAGYETGRLRFHRYCEDWLHVQKTLVRTSSYIKYESVISRHILPRLGECLPGDITTRAVETFKQELLGEKGLSPKTVKEVLRVLRSVLDYHAKLTPGLFQQVEILYPRECRKDPRVLTPKEQQRFTAYLLSDPDPCRLGILLALMTGMRIGEICALQWKNISCSERLIYISSTMQRMKDLATEESGHKTKVVISQPKSGTSVRVIPMPDSVASIYERIGAAGPDCYILTGTPHFMEPRTLQYRLKKYTDECGLEGVHFHTLRHTFATRCVEEGFEIKSLSEILGHSSTSVTLNFYVHSSLSLKRENMDKLKFTAL